MRRGVQQPRSQYGRKFLNIGPRGVESADRAGDPFFFSRLFALLRRRCGACCQGSPVETVHMQRHRYAFLEVEPQVSR